MALYFPPQNLAIEIVDDPLSAPVDRDAYPDIRVIQTTCLELSDFDRCERFMDRVAREMGEERPPRTPAERKARKRLLATLDQMLSVQSHLNAIGQGEAARAEARAIAGATPYTPEEWERVLATWDADLGGRGHHPGGNSWTRTEHAA